MNIEKYLIKKDKTDLLSALKALDEKILKEQMKKEGVRNIKELKNEIIDKFDMLLSFSKDDIFTKMYFDKLIRNENSMFMSAYEQDIESLFVFVYDNGSHYSYFIPDEIRKIIIKTFDF